MVIIVVAVVAVVAVVVVVVVVAAAVGLLFFHPGTLGYQKAPQAVPCALQIVLVPPALQDKLQEWNSNFDNIYHKTIYIKPQIAISPDQNCECSIM